MSDLTLRLTDAPDWEAWSEIRGALARFNQAHAGVADTRFLVVLATDPVREHVAAGLFGRTSTGILFVDLLFVDEDRRGHGLGSRMLRDAEEEAILRGCHAATLETASYQAPQFYAKLGYQEFGRIDCDRPGHARIFLRKALPAA